MTAARLQVNTGLLVETQAGKKLRKLTKHQDLNIKANAAEMLNVWKGVVSSEAAAVEEGKQQLGTISAHVSVSTIMRGMYKLQSLFLQVTHLVCHLPRR